MAKKIETANEPFNIRLHGIELLSSSFVQRPMTGFEATVSFNFNINVENKVEIARKLIVSFVKVDIKEVGKELLLASFLVAVGIEIINFEKVIGTEENNLHIPAQLDGIIKTISISTARGVIFSELRGTYLHSAHLPIVFNPIAIESKQ